MKSPEEFMKRLEAILQAYLPADLNERISAIEGAWNSKVDRSELDASMTAIEKLLRKQEAREEELLDAIRRERD